MEIRSRKTSTEAFTLIELLIVIAIISILGSAVTIVLNPAELLAESRDNQRMNDINSLTRVINLTRLDDTSVSLGNANTVYISIPYIDTDCDYPTANSLNLPVLPAGWSYRCSSEANYRKTNGDGWIPFVFTAVTTGPLLSSLPVDPINTTASNFYYAYYPGNGVYELNTKMESDKYSLAGALDRTSSDGGDDFTRLEKGTDITIAPWAFEFNVFTTTTVRNNKPGWYLQSGATVPTLITESDGTTYGRFSGYAWYEWQENIPFNPSATYKMRCRYRQVTDPTAGGKLFYCGYAGVGADGSTYVNISGANSNGSQHYHGRSSNSQTAGTPFTEYTGYTRGWAASGTSGPCTSAGSPCLVHQNARFLRPLFIVNYSSGNGIADIDYILVEKM